MRFLFFTYFFSIILFAQDFTALYSQGKGSRFVLEMDGVQSDISISVASSRQSSVNIEYYFSGARSGLPVELWQQFQISKEGKRLSLREGYQFTKGWERAERIDPASLATLNAQGVGDFLLGESDRVGANLVGEETIVLPAGKTKTLHFRQKRDGSTIDYWVSEEAKPISLVKLKSSGKSNYGITLHSLLSNVAPKIDPTKAVPPSEKGKALFQIPSLSNFH